MKTGSDYESVFLMGSLMCSNLNDRTNLLDKNIIKLIKEDKYITTEELSLKTGYYKVNK